MKKTYTTLAISVIITTLSAAESPLEQLPFGIEIGVTTNNEIESREVCTSQVKVRESHFRCESYNMNGRFMVYSSQNEIVRSVYFGYGHDLPSKWRSLGIAIAKSNVKGGTSYDDFLKIVKNEGCDIIETEIKPPYKTEVVWGHYVEGETNDYWTERRTLLFSLGNYHYEANFYMNDICYWSEESQEKARRYGNSRSNKYDVALLEPDPEQVKEKGGLQSIRITENY